MGNQMRHFTFFENWWDMAMSRDTDEKRLAFYDAIMAYAFDGQVPPKPVKGESHGPAWAAWDAYNAIKPILLTREVKVKAGQMGGLAGVGDAKARYGNQSAKRTQAESQAESQAENASDIASRKRKQENGKTQAINKSKVNKSKVKEGEYIPPSPPGNDFDDGLGIVDGTSPSSLSPLAAKANATADSDAAEMSTPTRQQAMDAAALMGIKPDIVDMWLEHMRRWDWHFGGGGRVTAANFRMSLSSFAARERRDREADAPPESNVPPVTERQREGMKRLREVINI